MALRGGFNPPQPVVVGDFDGDGKSDVVAGTVDDGALRLYVGHGDGTLAMASAPLCTTGGISSLVAADWNHDGKLDIAATVTHGSSIWILAGNGAGTFTSAAYGAGGDTGALAAADLDKDGKPDLVVANTNADHVSVMLNRLP